jgi:hypothetical protein
MKRAIYAALAVSVVISLTGCLSARGHRPIACMQGSCAQAPENCAACGCGNSQYCNDPNQDPNTDPSQGGLCRHGCRLCHRGTAGPDDGDAIAGGPPVGAVAYPYYTTRGPRDFLSPNPPSIGP